MTITEMRPAPPNEEVEESHIVCCRDLNLSLCGLDVTGEDFNPPGTPTTCAVCRDLDDTTFCPRGLECP